MKQAPRLIAACLALFTVLASASPDTFLHFSARLNPNGQAAEVYCDNGVVIRLRGKNADQLQTRAETISRRLNEAIFQPTTGDDVKTSGTNDRVFVKIHDTPIVTVDRPTARSADTTSRSLAESWVKNLRNVIPESYVTLRPFDTISVPVGEIRGLEWGGSTDPEAVTVGDDTIATAAKQADIKCVSVAGRKSGDTALSITAGEAEQVIRIICRKWAARIPKNAVLLASGPGLREKALRRAVSNLVHFVSRPEPHAHLRISEPVASPGGYMVDVSASGPEYFSVSTRQQIQRQASEVPASPANLLAVSNVPEKVTEPAVLLREHLYGGHPVRLLWHHVNMSRQDLRLSVCIRNHAKEDARVHLTGASAGPSDDEIFVGHTAAVRFMSDLFSSTGYVAHLPAGSCTYLVTEKMPVGRITSGTMRLAPQQSTDLVLEVIARPVDGSERPFAPLSDHDLNAQKTSDYIFAGTRHVKLAHTVGGGEWSFFPLGKDAVKNSHGVELMGSYGVLHRIEVAAENPTDDTVLVELTMRPRGGAARGTFWIDNSLVETPLLSSSATEAIIHKQTMAPRSTLKLDVATMPESGSHYPVMLTLRSWTK